MIKQSLLTIIIVCGFGCQTESTIDPYVVKLGKVWAHPIKDPYSWSRIQIAEAAPISESGKLCKAEMDIDGNNKVELLVRADIPARNHLVIVFVQTKEGYKYIRSMNSKELNVLEWEKVPTQ